MTRVLRITILQREGYSLRCFLRRLMIIADRESDRLWRIAEPCQRFAYDEGAKAMRGQRGNAERGIFAQPFSAYNRTPFRPRKRPPMADRRTLSTLSLMTRVLRITILQREGYSLRCFLRRLMIIADRESDRLWRIAEPCQRCRL